MVAITICLAGFTFAVSKANAQSSIWDFGVEINGLVFAKYNVGEPGTFVEHSYDFGNYYNWEEAQTVCPAGWRVPSRADYERLPAGMLTSHWGSYWVGDAIVAHGRWYNSDVDHDGDGHIDWIFMPEAGYIRDGIWYRDGTGWYWTNELQENSSVLSAYAFHFGNGGYYRGFIPHRLTPDPPMCCVRCITDVPASSVGEVSEKTRISLYPNPARDQLKIESGALRIEHIEVFDVMSRVVIEIQYIDFKNNVTTVDISHLPTGIYFVRIKTENGFITKKVVKI